jgi:hypothetical protein
MGGGMGLEVLGGGNDGTCWKIVGDFFRFLESGEHHS